MVDSLGDDYCLVEANSRGIPGEVEDSNTFLRWIAELIVQSSGGDSGWIEEVWRNYPYDTMRFELLLEERILPKADRPVLLAMDNADLIFRHQPRTRLFNLLRSFYEKGREPWDRFHVLATVRKTMRQLKETYGKGSFFVNARMIELPGLGDEQMRKLAVLHGIDVGDDELRLCRETLDGHPDFTSKIFAEAACSRCSVRSCLERAPDLFEDELRSCAENLDSRTADAFAQLLHHEGAHLSDEVSDKLYCQGLVRRRRRKHYVRCSIYRNLERWLS